ncbi:MAG: Trm112 family protein [Candidatus Caldarchaeum sp.]|nr:Trm112 family protein [Candidatus Caldarchaeum sp.]
MKYRLMDILACPMCRKFPLKLSVFERREISAPPNIRQCDIFCGYHDGFVKDLPKTECVRCYGLEITTGLVECSSCGRWYPVVEDIPRMLPDDLRDAKLDKSFVEQWQQVLPKHVVDSVKRE